MPGLSIRANGSSLPLVLIERIAHVRGGCTPGNSRPGQLAAARAHQEDSARARRGLAERSERKVFCGTSAGRTRFLFKKARPCPYRRAAQERKLGKQWPKATPFPAGGVPPLSIRALGSSLSLVLIKRIAHVRGGCTPGNSRPSAWAVNSRPGQLAAARAHRENSARARGLHPRQFAPWAARCRSCSSRG